MIEPSILGSNINRVKVHNMQAVLLSLLYHEPAYRVQIAELTSLSTTTITNIIDELIAMGLVAENGVMETTGRRGAGRPRSALQLVKNARYAIAVQFGVEIYRIAVANLGAEILLSHTYTYSRNASPRAIFDEITRQIEKIIVEVNLERDRIIGIGVGATGLVNYLTGVSSASYNLGWGDIPIGDWLSEKLNLPIVVDNNVKAMAVGEAFFGAGRNASSLVFVYGRTGVGSGIVIENRLLRGADLGAGEIGHMIIMTHNGLKCHCGQSGCLETLVSEPALIQQAEQAARVNPAGLLALKLNSGGGRRSDLLFQAAREGDRDAIKIVEQAAYYLGIALANLVNLLNPQMIVLGGLYIQGQDLILPVASQTLQATAVAGLGKKVELKATSFGWQAGIVGAASLVLTNLFYLNPEQI
jgi:glucokinase-like ROK family protein